MSLMEALQKRKSTRSFSEKKLTDQQLSDLLWAAFGINRPGESKRTAPSSRNQQEIDIYVFTEEGVFIYNAQVHSLIRIADEDLRKYTGTQDFVEKAAVNLVYIADHSKSKSKDPVDRSKTSHIDTGFIAQNVYLYCASQGLGCVVRGSVDKAVLADKLNLREDQEIIVAQSVGVIN
jgi:SagB-type dehydrogenase family enzyme